MVQSFYFDSNKSIFLYGDNFISRKLYKNLSENGYSIKGLIDQKYKTSLKDINGINLLSLNFLKKIIDDAVIIICMSNALTHETVLPELIKKGFENIIYLPMIYNRPLKEQEIIRCAYFSILNGDYKNALEIPKTISLNTDKWEIFKTSNNTAFFCHTDLLFTATKNEIKKNILPGRWNLSKHFLDNAIEIPLENLLPYKQLFSYLMGNEVYPKAYLDWMRDTEEEKKLLLENRRQLLQVYEQNYEYNFSFFLYSPAKANWNKKGYINICDGLHRCIYLMMKGKKLVPVVLSNEDYLAYEQFRKQNGK